MEFIVRLRRVGPYLALSLCLSIICCSPAKADAGVPMLAIIWPASWFLLLAIIPIEALIAVRILKTGWKRNLIMVSVANAFSTLLGIPVTWILLVLCQMFSGGGGAYGLGTNETRLLAVTLQSPWLIPYEADLNWMIPAATAVLCVPFFFMSVFVEEISARRFVEKEDRALLRRWAWQANGITYGCIVIGLVGLLAYVLHLHSKEKFGYVDISGHFTALPANVLVNGSFSEGFAPVQIGRKWGYIDKTFTSVIAPQYDKAGAFSEGIAPASISDKEMMIDAKGNVIVKAGAFDEVTHFSESLAAVRIEQKWGFINKTGQLAIKTKYDQVHPFKEGAAAVKIGNNWGFIDHENVIKIPAQYERADDFHDGLAHVWSGERDYYIDHSGRVAIHLADRNHRMSFSEALAPFESENQLWGFIDTKGKTSISAVFDRVEPFSNGLACVCTGAKHSHHGGFSGTDFSAAKYGYVDRTGSFAILPKFDYADSFSCERAAVRVQDKYGFIDKQGNMVIPAEFSKVEKFSDGLAAVGKRWGIDIRQ